MFDFVSLPKFPRLLVAAKVILFSQNDKKAAPISGSMVCPSRSNSASKYNIVTRSKAKVLELSDARSEKTTSASALNFSHSKVFQKDSVRRTMKHVPAKAQQQQQQSVSVSDVADSSETKSNRLRKSPKFELVDTFITREEVEVKNVLGSSASSLANAKKHWKQHAKGAALATSSSEPYQWETCRRSGCVNKAEHGAHVKVPAKSLWDWYIVPLCHRCNPRSNNDEFVLKPNTFLVKDHKAGTFTHIKSWTHHFRPFVSRVRSSFKSFARKIFKSR